MNYAYYEVVSTEEEKQERLRQILAEAGNDPHYFSAYIDVTTRYNCPWSFLKSMQSLKTAVRRGRVQILVIPSLQKLYMHEYRALSFLLSLMQQGVQIAVGTPSDIQTEEALLDLVVESQVYYVQTQVFLPLAFISDCIVYHSGKYCRIHLSRDTPDAFSYQTKTHMSLPKAVITYRSTGFYLYRSDVKGWYSVSPDLADFMLQTVQTFMGEVLT